MLKAIINARIFTGKDIETDKAVLTNNGTIENIVSRSEIPSGYSIHDLEGLNLAPSFIDLQIYGGNGKMFSHELSTGALQSTYEYCLAGGCTHFMITMATNSIENFFKGIDAVQEYWDQGGKGVLGLHLEGPYLNPAKKGAHVERYIKKPALEEVQQLLNRKTGVVKMITIAPEICDEEIIDFLLGQDIIVSAGHTNASYQQASNGFRKGIPVATHLFNAMSPLQHREPGMVGAIFDHPGVMSSLVCDGVHVDYVAVRISKQVMKERLFFITDAVAQITEGEYKHIFKGDRYTLPDGTLSGSSLTMVQCVKNAIRFAGIPLDEALRMASTYPAKLLGETYKLGKIEKGYQSSFIVFDDDLNVKKVIEN
ncbi:MAG: N-acetylglucosamine-6-phosphate deacetylase [Chitinophagaceae bacterium]|nr:N-acetylglucosamine-6-phosphate deacetylase [Chitinophagaceae bacterium]